MNKELILKYKTEFDHWLNGGKILAYHKKDDDPKWWTDQECVDFSSVDNFSYIIEKSLSPDYVLIVINDEYAEFRKALAEGKTVQYNFGNYGLNKKDFPNTWKDINLSIGILSDRAHPNNYRIKPEKPKFKVGDWIRTPHRGIFQIKHKVELSAWELTLGKAELWQPKPGEWCWCSVFGLIKVVCKATENENPCYLCWNPWKKLEQKLTNLEPFIGELPSHLKD